MDVCAGECTPIGTFKVEGDTDLLTPDELLEHEILVIAADREEIKSFPEHGVFKLRKIEFADVRPMDCIWIRKWKRKKSPAGKVY